MLQPRILRIIENNEHRLRVELVTIFPQKKKKKKRFSVKGNLGGGPLLWLFNMKLYYQLTSNYIIN